MKVRQEVQNFAYEMEKRLQAHDDRQGWENEPDVYLYDLLVSKVEKLGVTDFSDREAHLKLTTDIANFAMMLNDNMHRKESEHDNH
ncbi:hypothetical protein HCB21_02960 [Listeria booriae]|uniref:hypothetical protein n=1 Tax=Listeria booriae TaxID=1552123 RepID=UPI001628181D|nr:hypothetical protein [Listeria booriae]MBC1229779.1 hypothetical protein [Listeria booriae]MBC1230515.1 hypothetical protein [Listeria booriae]MBC1233128.1 hypothetical protein [Listeria booriae]MBC2158715.1 hypothetical protein [Listeria booriae]